MKDYLPKKTDIESFVSSVIENEQIEIWIGKAETLNAAIWFIWNYYNEKHQESYTVDWKKVLVPKSFVDIGLKKYHIDVWIEKLWKLESLKEEKEREKKLFNNMQQLFRN